MAVEKDDQIQLIPYVDALIKKVDKNQIIVEWDQ